MAIVTLKNIARSGLDLTIHDREFVVLAGSETSAIVRLIAGLENTSEGEIFFDDRQIDAIAPKDRDVALLAGDYTPYPRLSVTDNLAIGLRERNFAEAEIKKRIAAVAMELGLEKELEMNGQSLPPEQQRLVGLARVMVRQPNVYLFDEPFAGLESEATRHGRAEIVKLHQRSSATIVYATSSPAEALAFGKRTVIVIDGVIQQDGSAQEIYNAPANLAVARFFGDPPMNLIAGTLKQERDSLVFSEEGDGTIALSLPTDRFSGAKEFLAKSVVLGIRPEDISLEAGGSGFRALIQRTESRGGDTDLYLQTGAHSLIARNLCSAPAESGQRGQFRMALEKAFLFDAKSGRRVPPEA